MTGPALVGRATHRGVPLALWSDAIQRHVTIWGGATPISRASNGSGIAYDMAGGGGNIGGLSLNFGGAVAGHWLEFDLGYLETNRPWDVFLSGFGGPTRGILTAKIDGTTIATIDLYNATAFGWAQLYAWTPPAGVGKIRHVFRVEVNSKNASASGYNANLSLCAFDRSLGNSTIAL